MSKPPLSNADAEAMMNHVEPYVCPIQFLPKSDTRRPPGGHVGTGWLFDYQKSHCIVTCEHVARLQKCGSLGYQCYGSDSGISIEGEFINAPHPVDAAVATVQNTFEKLQHCGRCVPTSMLASVHKPVSGELLYAYGFPGSDATQVFETQIVRGTAVFLREVELNDVVFQELPPHPSTERHISLAWNPELALPMFGTDGPLSLPDGMSGSPLWNTRYEEITRQGGTWSPTDARITGMIWGHSAKACQLYATPIEVLVDQLLY